MKHFLCGILCFVCAGCTAQTVSLFDSVEFDNTYKVVGIGPHNNIAGDPYKHFWFVAEKLPILKKLKKEWAFSEKGKRILEKEPFRVFLIKNNELTRTNAIINIKEGNICFDGNWYAFDVSLLSQVHEECPLVYRKQEFIFKTIVDYEACRDSLVKQPEFLFMFRPSFAFDGEFTITLDKTEEIKNPSAAIAFLKPVLSKYVKPDEFVISYSLSEFNLNNREKLRMSVACTKRLFDYYKENPESKGEWVPKVFEATAFWKL